DERLVLRHRRRLDGTARSIRRLILRPPSKRGAVLLRRRLGARRPAWRHAVVRPGHTDVQGLVCPATARRHARRRNDGHERARDLGWMACAGPFTSRYSWRYRWL